MTRLTKAQTSPQSRRPQSRRPRSRRRRDRKSKSDVRPARRRRLERVMSRPAVFLDRDGTLIEDREYLSDPAGVCLLPGVVEGLRRLRDAGFALVVVTNQSG